LSAHGPILPIDAPLLALTPISAFRPRRWRGALLPRRCEVVFDILEADKRRSALSPITPKVREVISVTVSEDTSMSVAMLFDPDRSLEERILAEQFIVDGQG